MDVQFARPVPIDAEGAAQSSAAVAVPPTQRSLIQAVEEDVHAPAHQLVADVPPGCGVPQPTAFPECPGEEQLVAAVQADFVNEDPMPP